MKRKHWKSSVALLLSALIVSSSMATLTASAQSTEAPGIIPANEVNIPLLGDANGDGRINGGDKTAIQRHMEQIEPIDDAYLEAADINEDGEIDETDLTILGEYLAEYEVPYLIGQPIKVVLGDANGDGRIDSRDATAIQRHVANLEPIADRYLKAADINGDGSITDEDRGLLQQYVSMIDIDYPMGEEVLDPLEIEVFSATGVTYDGDTGFGQFNLDVSGAKLKNNKLKTATIVIEQYGQEVATVDYLADYNQWTTNLRGIFTATITVTDWADRTATATDTFEIQGSHFARIGYETDTESGEPMVGTPVVFNYDVVGVVSRYAHYNKRQITIKKKGEEVAVISDTYQNNSLVWTPTEAGTYDLTFEMSGYGGGHAVKTIVMDVYDTLSASLSLDNGQGEATIPYGVFVPAQLVINGGKAPFTYEITKNAGNPGADLFFGEMGSGNISDHFTGVLTKANDDGSFQTTCGIKIGHPDIYKIDVKVTDALGQVVNQTITVHSISLFVQQVSFSKQDAQAGDTIRISASSNKMGVVSDCFRYTVKDPDGQTTTLIPSSRYTGVNWTPKTAGEYTVTATLVYGESVWGETISTKEVTYTVQESDLKAEINVEPGSSLLKGTEATVSANVTGGVGSYRYRFGYVDADSTDVILQDYSTKDFVKFTPENDETQVFVEVKDSAGNTVRDALFITQFRPQIFSFVKDAYSTAPGTRYAFRINSNAGDYPVEYRVVLESDSDIITLNAPNAYVVWYPENAGHYVATAQMIYQDEVVASTYQEFDIIDPDYKTTVTLDSAIVPSNNTVGINVASDADIYTYKYSYIVNGKEKVIKDFTSDTHVDFTPKTAGDYTIKVVTKRTYNYGELIECFNENTAELKVVSLSIAALTASASEAKVGDTVTFTAAPSTNMVPVTFEYTATLNGETETLTNGVWTPKTAGSYVVKATMLYNGKAVQSKTMAYIVNKKTADNLATIYYKGTSSMIQYKLANGEWTTPVKLVRVNAVAGVTHKYVVNMGSEKSVEVRFCTSKGVLEDNNGLNFTFNPGLYTVVDGMITTMKDRTMLNNNTLTTTASVSAKNAAVGQTITLSADSTGATGTCKYTFTYKQADAAAWTTIQTGTNNSAEFVPDTVGKYHFCIKATDDSGVVQKQYFSVEVFEAIENTSALSAETIKFGESVTVNASATGGSGKYVYTVYYKKTSSTTGKWTKAQAASTNAAVDITFAAAVKYDVRVVVKDVVTKETSEKVLTVKVTK